MVASDAVRALIREGKTHQLRNTIAHSLSVEKIAEKMKQLKDRYFAFLTEEQAAGLADQPDDYIAMTACSTCACRQNVSFVRGPGKRYSN